MRLSWNEIRVRAATFAETPEQVQALERKQILRSGPA